MKRWCNSIANPWKWHSAVHCSYNIIALLIIAIDKISSVRSELITLTRAPSMFLKVSIKSSSSSLKVYKKETFLSHECMHTTSLRMLACKRRRSSNYSVDHLRNLWNGYLIWNVIIAKDWESHGMYRCACKLVMVARTSWRYIIQCTPGPIIKVLQLFNNCVGPWLPLSLAPLASPIAGHNHFYCMHRQCSQPALRLLQCIGNAANQPGTAWGWQAVFTS